MKDFPERFKVQVVKEGKCWLWKGYTRPDGYGVTPWACKRKIEYVHRVAYTLTYGPIPKGFVIDHLCRNRRCVNPDHLEAVTIKENTARGLLPKIHAAITHCKRGHEFTDENTVLMKNGRTCRVCKKMHNRRASMKRNTPRLALNKVDATTL